MLLWNLRNYGMIRKKKKDKYDDDGNDTDNKDHSNDTELDMDKN